MDRKRRILICGILPPPTFGHSMLYHMLMNSAFVDNFDITFLNMNFWTYGKHKRVTPDKLFKLVNYYIQFIWLTLTRRPDFILYNMSFYKMPFLKDMLFCFTGKFLGCRYVIHDMGRYSRELYDGSSWLMKKFVRLYLRWAAASIIQGEGVRPAYEGFMDRSKLFVVPGSVEDTAGLNVPARDKGGKLCVLYFSFLSESKGVYTAFSAAEKVIEENPGIKFTFAGPVESEKVRQNMDALISRFPENVEYAGYIEGVEKRTAYFRGADIFIFPTVRETFGLVLLHAMAEGVPVISSVEGCIPEIVEDGVNGCLIEKGNSRQLADKILRLAGDQPLRKAMGEANRRRYLDRYSPERYGRRMVEVCGEIASLSV